MILHLRHHHPQELKISPFFLHDLASLLKIFVFQFTMLLYQSLQVRLPLGLSPAAMSLSVGVDNICSLYSLELVVMSFRRAAQHIMGFEDCKLILPLV